MSNFTRTASKSSSIDYSYSQQSYNWAPKLSGHLLFLSNFKKCQFQAYI